jgi:four helix bundle protein
MTARGKDVGIKRVKDLKVYNIAFGLAMEIFQLTRNFPKEEQYSLTDQMRRSSRSVAINIREGFAKKRYENVFIRHLNDSMGSSEETRGWLDFSVRCGYIDSKTHETLDTSYDGANAMLYNLIKKWKTIK